MTQTELPFDLEKESQDDWLPRFLNSDSSMVEVLTATPMIQTSLELVPHRSSGKE
jgi:hypothetical protein